MFSLEGVRMPGLPGFVESGGAGATHHAAAYDAFDLDPLGVEAAAGDVGHRRPHRCRQRLGAEPPHHRSPRHRGEVPRPRRPLDHHPGAGLEAGDQRFRRRHVDAVGVVPEHERGPVHQCEYDTFEAHRPGGGSFRHGKRAHRRGGRDWHGIGRFSRAHLQPAKCWQGQQRDETCMEPGHDKGKNAGGRLAEGGRAHGCGRGATGLGPADGEGAASSPPKQGGIVCAAADGALSPAATWAPPGGEEA